MINLELDTDEGILLQTKEISLYGEDDNETEIQELILTNKNLICIVDKGWFKTDLVTEKIPLSDIKVFDGRAQIIGVKDSWLDEPAFQILYKDGKRIRYIFDKSFKKEISLWINAINKAVNGETNIAETAGENFESEKEAAEANYTYNSRENTSNPMENTGSKEKGGILDSLAGALGALNVNAKDVAKRAKKFAEGIDNKMQTFQQGEWLNNEYADENSRRDAQSVSEVPLKQQSDITEKVSETPHIPKETDSGENKFSFCSNCGSKLSEGAKFCHSCGASVGMPVQPQEQSQQAVEFKPNHIERQQEYVGKIFKCPNCGAVINEIAAICPECGMQITGKTAVSSVKSFEEQLMEIELRRKKSFGVLGLYGAADPADKQKLALIRNFPIPNTIDDILEFMLLAVANIDVKLSKKTWANSGGGMEVLAVEMPRVISNAWVRKLEQCYKKAEIAFPGDSAFSQVQKIYFEKMKELKIIKRSQ